MRILLIGVACFGMAAAPLECVVAQVQARRAPPGTGVMLRPGDRVRLKVWREPDLSGEFVVDERGIMTFPKVGRVDVQHVTSDSLKSLLVTRLAESLRDPSVDVTVLRRVSILGSVRNPGVYFVDPTTTVSDALAMAGGVNPDGQQDSFQLLRDGKRLQVALSGSVILPTCRSLGFCGAKRLGLVS